MNKERLRMAEDHGCSMLSTIPEDYEDNDYDTDINCLCQDCTVEYATHRFLHLDGRDFFLCEFCYYAADHESNYGEHFVSKEYLKEIQDTYEELGYDAEYDNESDED